MPGVLDCVVCPRLNIECKLSEKIIFFNETITFALTDFFGSLFSGFASKNLILALKTFLSFSF